MPRNREFQNRWQLLDSQFFHVLNHCTQTSLFVHIRTFSRLQLNIDKITYSPKQRVGVYKLNGKSFCVAIFSFFLSNDDFLINAI